MRHAAKVNGVRFARANEGVSPGQHAATNVPPATRPHLSSKFLISMDLPRLSRGAFAGLPALRGDAVSGSPA